MRSRIHSARVALVALAVVVALLPGIASAQAIIKVNDNVNFRLGILLQGWADWTGQSTPPGTPAGFQQNLFLRRARFFARRSGRQGRHVLLHDGQPEPRQVHADGLTQSDDRRQGARHRLHRPGRLPRVGGRERVPDPGRPHPHPALPQLQLERRRRSSRWTTAPGPSRRAPPRSRPSAATPASRRRATSRATTSSTARGVYSGFRAPGVKNSFRFTGRLQYNVFDVEKVQFYPGTYYGNEEDPRVRRGLRRAERLRRLRGRRLLRLARSATARHHGAGRLHPLRRRRDLRLRRPRHEERRALQAGRHLRRGGRLHQVL